LKEKDTEIRAKKCAIIIKKQNYIWAKRGNFKNSGWYSSKIKWKRYKYQEIIGKKTLWHLLKRNYF
jgi:hypothetical protein